jgi:hypothetical protein
MMMTMMIIALRRNRASRPDINSTKFRFSCRTLVRTTSINLLNERGRELSITSVTDGERVQRIARTEQALSPPPPCILAEGGEQPASDVLET